MRQQYFDYCRVLSTLERDLESMEIFRLLFDPKAELYSWHRGDLKCGCSGHGVNVCGECGRGVDFHLRVPQKQGTK